MELTKETSLFKKDAIKTDVTAAAATATNYIDDVPNSSQTGMTLQPASNTANNYIQLDSDGLAVYKAGQLIASYGQSILLYHPGISPLNAAVEITNSSARFTGQIQADSGYIGGWSIGADTNQSLHNGAANVSPAPGAGKIILSTGISGSNVQNGLLPPNKTWAFTAGNQFGVTTDGELYASGAHLEDLSVGNYSDATTNHLYGNCVWSPPFAAYFNTDLGNTRRTYQGWTIEQNTGEYFDFDATNNWLVVDYSDYADKATTKVLQQNTGIIAPNTNFTISANLGTDCKVVFGGVEISGTDWQTADDGRKYATITTTASTTSGVFEIWPVASENYIFKGNKFKLEKSDSYSSWTTLDEQIGKTGNAISQSAEATASYFLNFTSADGLKISNNADPSTTTTDYIQITSNGVKTVYDNTHFSNLTSDGLRIYSGNSTYPVASFITDATNNNASSVNFYKNGTNIPLVTINQSGATFNGDGTIGASGGIKLSTTNFTCSSSIGGSATGITNWRFTIGNQFGVTADGTLYANAGKIGGCNIESGVLKIGEANIKEQLTANVINTSTIKLDTIEYDYRNYATVTSYGLDIYQDGESIAEYGGSARIGREDSYHTLISGDSFSINDSDENIILGISPSGSNDEVTTISRVMPKGTNVRTVSLSFYSGKTVTFFWGTTTNIQTVTFPSTSSTNHLSYMLGYGNGTLTISCTGMQRASDSGNYYYRWRVVLTRTSTSYSAGIITTTTLDLPLMSFAGSIEAAGSISAGHTIKSNGYDVYTTAGGTISGNVEASGHVTAGTSLNASANVNADGNITAGGYITSGGSIEAGTSIITGSGGNIRPPNNLSTTGNINYCGLENYRWNGIYSKTEVNVSSDRKAKDITGSIDFAKDLIMNLRPVDFMFKESDHRRKHMGLIAQEAAETCKNIKENLSFVSASYINSSVEDDDYKKYLGEEVDDKLLSWGITYGELIAPIIKVIQDQYKEIEQLKKEVAELKNK